MKTSDERGPASCAACGNSQVMRPTRTSYPSVVAGVAFEVEAKARACRKCGELYFSIETIDAVELAIAVELGRLGQRTGDAVRYMRKALGLRALDLARLLAVTADTVSRWERETVPIDPATFAVLGALVDDLRAGSTEMRDRLEAARDSEPPAQPVTVVVK